MLKIHTSNAANGLRALVLDGTHHYHPAESETFLNQMLESHSQVTVTDSFQEFQEELRKGFCSPDTIAFRGFGHLVRDHMLR